MNEGNLSGLSGANKKHWQAGWDSNVIVGIERPKNCSAQALTGSLDWPVSCESNMTLQNQPRWCHVKRCKNRVTGRSSPSLHRKC